MGEYKLTLLILDNLNKQYGSFNISNVSLSLSRGQILCLLGPSGCGKTTLLRLVAGLEAPDTGTVWLASRNVTDTPVYKRQIGMMFQDLALFPHKSVFENVAYGLQMLKQPRIEIQEKTKKMLALVGLADMARRGVGDLSGGEQQRVALARSLAPQPRLLMLDEPLGALDRSLREHLLQEIRSILKDLGVTAIFVTHDQAEAFTMGDVVGVMDQGRLLQLDTPKNLYMKPKHPFVARFLGLQNLLSGTVRKDSALDTEIGTLTVFQQNLQPGEHLTVVVRPEIAKQHVPDSEVQHYHKITGLVQHCVFSGQRYRVTLRVGHQRVLRFDLPNTEPPPDIGRDMDIWIDVKNLILIRSDG